MSAALALSAPEELCLEGILSGLRQCRPERSLSTLARIADVGISADCDDASFFPEFFKMFGGDTPSERRQYAATDLHATVRCGADGRFGAFRLEGSNDLPMDMREFEGALAQGIFDALPARGDGWIRFAFRGERDLAFAFRDRDCVFRLDAHWRRSVALFLFWRLMRIRSDAVFFHASALGIHGAGTIFVGPPGAGKSTTALALAARGHNFLSDELAAFVPARGELIAFRRPVGIRPGPRAAAVSNALSTEVLHGIERDGFARIGIDALLPVANARAVPLQRIVFLRGFARRPLLERIEPGREEVAALQPGMISFLDVSRCRRVFDLTRMLARSTVYRCELGEPDETAQFLEEAFASS